jgi:2-aminoadipate transaminase
MERTSLWNSRFAARTTQMRRSTVRELLKLTAQRGMISLAGGLPAPELFPVTEIQEAAHHVLECQAGKALQYGETEGLAELRDCMALRAAKSGAPVCRDNVLITSGAQQALDLIGRVFLDPGDAVLVENPTYLAALSAWRPLQVEFLAVNSDGSGMRVDELEDLLQERPKLLYCVPNFQNPQGTTLIESRRSALVQSVRASGTILVEADPYGELRFTGRRLPSLLELDTRLSPGSELDSQVVQVGTFSKVLVPGFRVGWVIAPAPVIEKLVQAKQAADLHTSTFNQHLVLQLIRQGLLERQIPRLIATYQERCHAMLDALGEFFPEESTWTEPEGGMFILVTLPCDQNAGVLLQQALKLGVAFVPGQDFYIDGSRTDTLRLNFSNVRPELIRTAVERLGRLVQAGDGAPHRSSRAPGGTGELRPTVGVGTSAA